MALYGVDFYGATRYGPRIYLDFNADPLRARAVGDYDSLLIDWVTPVGQWSELRLVRNAYGTPVTQDDGVVLVSSQSGPAVVGDREGAVRSFTDTNLEGGRFQYYAIWLYVPSVGEWTRAADVVGLPLRDFGYRNRLWELTPTILRTRSSSLLDGDNEELRSYEALFAYQLDAARAGLETLRDVNDPDLVSGNMLPLMAQQWGQFFEPELGMKQMRLLLRDTVHLYRNKGTVPGIEGFVSAISGYGATVQPLKNLMLDYNDSSAEESIGNWGFASLCTVNRYVADDIINAVPDAIGSTMRAAGVFKMTATAAGTPSTRTPVQPWEDGRGRGIPVTEGTTYTFSGYARSGSGGATAATLGVYWMDKNGAWLTEYTGAATADPAADWTTRIAATGAAPAGAVYAGLQLAFDAAAPGDVVYWDALQFEAGSAATAYEDARLIDIDVFPERINLIPNPGLEADTGGWSAGGTVGTLARSTTQAHSGVASLQVTWPGATPQTSSAYTTVAVEPGQQYIASVWVLQTASPRVYLRAGGAVSEPSTTDAEWQRLSVTFVAGAATANIEVVTFDASTAGDVTYVDDVLLEIGVSLQPYFDGSTYAFTGESLWAGDPNASASGYYPQRRSKNYRMAALLPEYTPMGSSFRLNYVV